MTYHVNPDTGDSGVCTASVKPCKYGGEDGTENHFQSEAEALAARDVKLVEIYGKIPSHKRKQQPAEMFVDRGDERYQKVTTDIPKVHGTRILLWGTEHTVHVNDVGHVKLYEDRSGDDMTNRYKGKTVSDSYDLIGGPDTEAFRSQIRFIEGHKQLVAARNDFSKTMLTLRRELVGNDNNVSCNLVPKTEKDGKVSDWKLYVEGWNDKTGKPEFSFTVEELGDKDGEGNERGFGIEGKGNARTNRALEILENLNNSLNLNEAFRKKERLQYEAVQVTQLNKDVDAAIKRENKKKKD